MGATQPLWRAGWSQPRSSPCWRSHFRGDCLQSPLRIGLVVEPQSISGGFVGSRPLRSPKGESVATGHDVTRRDVLMPHPIDVWVGGQQILNPNDASFESLQPLFDGSYNRVARKLGTSLTQLRRTRR